MANKPEWVLNLGTYSHKKKEKQPGLDLAKAVTDTLENRGIIGTVNCCNFYPMIPHLIVADATTPTESETKNIPLGGMFIAKESATAEDWYVWVKDSASTAFDLGDNA